MTGGLANPVVSLFDDFLAIGGVAFAVVLPVIAAIVVIVLVVFGVRALRRASRGTRPHSREAPGP
jgi:heme exporter protein D